MSAGFGQSRNFKVDMDELDLKQLGKITDYSATDTELSFTFKHNWTFTATGTDIQFTTGDNGLPMVTGGTIDSLSFDGPGKADFSVSGLDMQATALASALEDFKNAKFLHLVLGADATISGSGFRDSLFGGAGHDTIDGNAGRDWIDGGSGDDILNGGKDADVLIGGDGTDTFVFGKHSGKDVVTDFDTSVDVLDLTGAGYKGSLDELLGSATTGHGHHSSDLTLHLGHGATITLDDVAVADLNSTNVLL